MTISGDGGPGTSVEYGLVMLGFHVHETGRVVEERHDPDGSTHWRWEFEGGISGWLTCDHTPEDGGTLITSEMDYALPGSVLGKVAERLLIENMGRRDLHTTLENLKLLWRDRRGLSASSASLRASLAPGQVSR